VFIKIVIVLLLLIVAASLLTGSRGANVQHRQLSRVRPLMVRVALVLIALGLALATLHLAGCAPQESGFHASPVKDAKFGRLATLDGLTDHTGRRLASADFSGKVVVVFFGYTQCPDICPTALSAMKAAMHLLGPESDRVQVLFVTVDPERDTREVLATYVPWFDPRFLGVFGDTAATLAAAKEFRVFFSKVKGESAIGYSIDHTATSYVFDPSGRLRLLIRQGENPEHMAADLRLLLAGK
jgi:protein SCO1/2